LHPVRSRTFDRSDLPGWRSVRPSPVPRVVKAAGGSGDELGDEPVGVRYGLEAMVAVEAVRGVVVGDDDPACCAVGGFDDALEGVEQ
jgi:hypothetical protein